MKTTISIVATTMALASCTSALVMSGCAIQHNSGNAGNQFTIVWSGVPSASTSTICGHFDSDLKGITDSQSISKIADDCQTDSSGGMTTKVTLNKQSCQTQVNAIMEAMRQALGSGGTFNDANTCDFAPSGC